MTLTVEQIRDLTRQATPVVEDAAVEPVEVAGVPAEWVVADGVPDDAPTILYLHSGAYLAGSPAASRAVSAALSRAAGARVLAPDYRLAPEHPFPAQFDDCLAVYRSLGGVAAVGGDAAGAALAVSVLADARDAGLPLAGCAFANSPYCDLTGSSPSLEDPARYQGGLTKETIDWLMATYLAAGNIDPRDPRHSPIYRDLTGLPPLLVQVGGLDPCHDDGVRLAAQARSCGVAATFSAYPQSEHIWIGRGAAEPEAERAFAEIGAFVRAHAGLPQAVAR